MRWRGFGGLRVAEGWTFCARKGIIETAEGQARPACETDAEGRSIERGERG